MYYAGIDVAKKKHYVYVLDEDTELSTKAFWIHSDILGLRELIRRLVEVSCQNDNFIIGVVSTGAFSENLYEYLSDNEYKVILLNSYQTAKYRDLALWKRSRMILLMLMSLQN